MRLRTAVLLSAGFIFLALGLEDARRGERDACRVAAAYSPTELTEEQLAESNERNRTARLAWASQLAEDLREQGLVVAERTPA